MSAPSHYQINVARAIPGSKAYGGGPTYTHLFATDPMSGHYWDAAQAMAVLSLMQEKFPAPEYSVTMTHWRCSGVDVTR